MIDINVVFLPFPNVLPLLRSLRGVVQHGRDCDLTLEPRRDVQLHNGH
jgi:hypothetical protein